MASPFQQQALRRKLIYLGSVVLLFTASWVWRRNVVEAKAKDLGLLEQVHGDVSAADRTIELLLTGSRGLATTALWWTAMEQQKKNQWNDLELTVRSLTRLQPHFITPWQFQSWNLAYNVSVESDRIFDKYFYVTRGIQLLAVGERQNRNNPELRRDLGFYHQHKICGSDETNTMRSLFQLSCIPPVERDPELFRDDKGNIKWDEFARFCTKHPQLVRRLYAPPLPYDLRKEYPKFRCGTAREVIAFLEDNKDVPSLFVEKSEDPKGWKDGKRKPDELDRFPLLPPRHTPPEWYTKLHVASDWEDEYTQERLASGTVPDEFDAYTVARAWYSYSLEPLPPPGDMPGESQPIQDRLRQRIPQHMATIIFRSSPPLAQNFVAERLQQEGWFDGEPFALTNWFKDAPRLSPKEKEQQREQVGEKRDWALESWGKALKMWENHGKDNHLWFEVQADQTNMEKKARAFAKRFGISTGMIPPRLDEAKLSEEEAEWMKAAHFMSAFSSARQLTNFAHFRMRALVEGQMLDNQPRTAIARKLVYQAEQLRLVAQAPLRALAKYEDPRALQAWRKVLEDNPEFVNDPTIQEESFEMELKYVRLYRKVHGANLTHNLLLESFLGQTVAQAPLGVSWPLLDLYGKPLLLVGPAQEIGSQLAVKGPFDVTGPGGTPLIPESIKMQVLVRRELKKPPTGPPPGMQPPPGMGPGMRPPQRRPQGR
jgi:hypothetical protein